LKKFSLKPEIVKNILEGPDPQDTPIILTHKNIYIFPSKFGLIWFVLLSIMFLIGLNYRNNLVLILCFALISFSLVSMIYTFFQLYDLKISPSGNGKDCFAGEFCEFFLYIQENKGKVRYLEIKTKDYKREFILHSHSNKVVKYKVKTKSRGIIYAPKFIILSYYPFGIFRCWTVQRFSNQAFVYPRPVSTPELNKKNKKDTMVMNGESGLGVEDFMSLDKYQPTDPGSKIYWKAYAKNNRLIKKVFYGGEGTHIIWLDLNNYFPYHDLEKALGILCYQILEAAKIGACYGLRLDNLTFGPKGGEEHKQKCLKALATYPEIKTNGENKK